MPKYILIGLIVVIAAFMIMNYWPKLQETTKNKAIALVGASNDPSKYGNKINNQSNCESNSKGKYKSKSKR